MAEGNKIITARKISQIQISLYSQKELMDITVAKVTKRGDNTKEKNIKNEGGRNTKDAVLLTAFKVLDEIENEGVSLVDLELGATDEKDCKTCNQSIMRCPGHFGRIELYSPFITKIDGQVQILNAILNSFCGSCMNKKTNYPRLVYDDIALEKVKNLKNQTKLFALKNMKKSCPIHGVTYEVKKTDNFVTKKQGSEKPVIMDAKVVEEYLKKIRTEDLEKIGVFNRPENMIINIIPVLPNYLRLNYVDDDGTVHPQGTNAIYSKIIETNNLIGVFGKMIIELSSSSLREKMKTSKKDCASKGGLKNISSLSMEDLRNCINMKTDELRELHHELILSNETKNNVKSIKMILDKKKGLFRNVALGKRGDFCARSTVSPDPTLNIYEVALPKRIAKKLTTLEIVNKKNINDIQSMITGVLQENCDIKSIQRFGELVKDKSEIPDDLLSSDNILVREKASKLKDLLKIFSEGNIFEVIRESDVIEKPSDMKEIKDSDIIIYKKKVKDASDTDDIIGYERKRSNILISSLNPEDYNRLRVKEKDAIHRYLRDGDVVTVGRNPSLHKHSLQALIVQLKDGYTIGMPIQLCAGYGMDF